MHSRYEHALKRYFRRIFLTIVVFLINLHIYFRILRTPHAFSPNIYSADAEYKSPIKPIGRVFIASNHWNTAKAIHDFWGEALLSLVKTLGAQNVYVSIYENGSYDNSKESLRWLDEQLGNLGVSRTILMEENSHWEQLNDRPTEARSGWIYSKKRAQYELRRIPVLAKLRNRVLEPLQALQAEGKGNFARVLFLNDVVFTPEDVMDLLRTRQGNYSAACAIDFQKNEKFYDTFALRDSRGREAASQRFPFFGKGTSRNAILKQKPIPVKSCWNGIVAFDATPFQRATSPLRFRGTPDSLANYHLEASECCLIHADNPSTNLSRHGVWVNPSIRVGYAKAAYDYQRAHMYGWYEWMSGIVIRIATNVLGLPWRKKIVGARIDEWTKADASAKRSEPGEWCLVDEMQILAINGWRHD